MVRTCSNTSLSDAANCVAINPVSVANAAERGSSVIVLAPAFPSEPNQGTLFNVSYSVAELKRCTTSSNPITNIPTSPCAYVSCSSLTLFASMSASVENVVISGLNRMPSATTPPRSVNDSDVDANSPSPHTSPRYIGTTTFMPFSSSMVATTLPCLVSSGTNLNMLSATASAGEVDDGERIIISLESAYDIMLRVSALDSGPSAYLIPLEFRDWIFSSASIGSDCVSSTTRFMRQSALFSSR